MNESAELRESELSLLIATRLQDISTRKSQKEVAQEAGFPSTNVLSIIKRGATKLSLDRVEAMAKALDLDLAAVMMPALRQYFKPDTISAMRDTFIGLHTPAEREAVALVRDYLKPGTNMSLETREAIKEILKNNQSASG